MTEQGITLPPGNVILTTHGAVTMETCGAWGNSRALAIQQGLTNVTWQIVPGGLVDKVRNEATAAFLRDTAKYTADNPNGPSPWLLFIDADMLWQPDAIARLLLTAYRDLPTADIVGAWCPLRGKPYLPTIDPGSGTWEPIEPGVGPVDVMRTGSAFILIKRHVFAKMAPPWYSVHTANSPLDVLQQFDTLTLAKFDGTNPFRAHPAWGKLEVAAADEQASRPPDPIYPWSHVGEDSGLCDRARALGFRIVVDTNIVVQHVDRKVIGPQDHLDAMREMRRAEDEANGILETV